MKTHLSSNTPLHLRPDGTEAERPDPSLSLDGWVLRGKLQVSILPSAPGSSFPLLHLATLIVSSAGATHNVKNGERSGFYLCKSLRLWFPGTNYTLCATMQQRPRLQQHIKVKWIINKALQSEEFKVRGCIHWLDNDNALNGLFNGFKHLNKQSRTTLQCTQEQSLKCFQIRIQLMLYLEDFAF